MKVTTTKDKNGKTLYWKVSSDGKKKRISKKEALGKSTPKTETSSKKTAIMQNIPGVPKGKGVSVRNPQRTDQIVNVFF